MVRIIIASFMLILSFTHTVKAEDYFVIANTSDSTFSIPTEAKLRIKQLYLKESKNWKASLTAKPFARPSDSPVQIAFEKTILGMSRNEINAHWLRLKQIRGETPPRAIGSTTILIRQLERKPGAFAVIRQDEYAQNENVIVLLAFSAE